MILYLASPRSELMVNGGIECPLNGCKQQGRTYPHLCLTTEPLAGFGEYLFSVDIPAELATEYEYKEEFLQDGRARFFAIPLPILAHFTLTRQRFEEVTGRPWNKWTVTVLDRRTTRHSKIRARWALIWLSREGVASAKVAGRVGDGEDTMTLSVEITATSDFDPLTDYIVIEDHTEEEQSFFPEPKETWKLRTLAGQTPRWVSYPSLWKAWVWDKEVQQSAVDYLISVAPEVKPLITYAKERTERHEVTAAWRKVSDEVARVLSRRLRNKFDLGRLAGHSWTAVAAMPLRIANRLSENLPYQSWQPPKPRPDYEDPDKSGRVILANQYGPYPDRGPGVDHTPQSRPYEHREGETPEKKRPFNVGQNAPAARLAIGR